MREKNQLQKSLHALTEAVVLAAQRQEIAQMIAALGERCLVYKHSFLQSRNKSFLVLAKQDAESMQRVNRG
ncbi:MAG: hypothetical protein M1383_03285 [Patescibacteria group bacterium]|nr:hypothetical protein [Patescibacteria group bacterium]